MSKNEIYIDAEWYIGGNVFLIGYASHDKDHGQLYDSYLNVRHFNKLIREKLYIYVYGPDIGVLEKFYGINLRDNFICVNLLKIFRRHIKARSVCGLAFGFWLTEIFKFTTMLNSQKLTLRCCYMKAGLLEQKPN